MNKLNREDYFLKSVTTNKEFTSPNLKFDKNPRDSEITFLMQKLNGMSTKN